MKVGDRVKSKGFYHNGDRGVVHSIGDDTLFPIRVSIKGYDYPLSFREDELEIIEEKPNA